MCATKCFVKACFGFIWLRIGSAARFYEQRNKPVGPKKGRRDTWTERATISFSRITVFNGVAALSSDIAQFVPMTTATVTVT